MGEYYKDIQQQEARLIEAEFLFYMQHAKVTYLKGVDRNSTFFHAMVKFNYKQNEIVAIEKADGNIIVSFSEVVCEFLDHFQAQLATTSLRETFQ